MRRVAIASLLALAPATASAANQLKKRVPAIFDDTPCLMTVDKAVDGPVLHLDYSVPYDDLDRDPTEELEDSRTMQFFAFDEQRWDFKHPVWITQSDYDRAEANGDVTGMYVYTDDDILEKTSLWSPDAWVRITADDARVPISMTQAAMGFDWDITDVHVGTWMIGAYTWEPELNLWSYRYGAVRIEDSSTPDVRPGPTVFLQDGQSLSAEVDVPYTVTGCIHADAGSTYTASFGPIAGIGEPMWMPFVTDAAVVNGELRLDFVPPEMTADSLIKVRVDVTDPNMDVFTAFTPQPIAVTDGGTTGETDAETGVPSDDTTDTTDGSNDDGDDTSAQDGGGGLGFGCRTGHPAPVPAALLLLLLGLSPRGRRRC